MVLPNDPSLLPSIELDIEILSLGSQSKNTNYVEQDCDYFDETKHMYQEYLLYEMQLTGEKSLLEPSKVYEKD